MAKLHAVIENLDDAPESVRDYYVESTDREGNVTFVLQLEDDVRSHPTVLALQHAHEAQKQDNRELRTLFYRLEKLEKQQRRGNAPC